MLLLNGFIFSCCLKCSLLFLENKSERDDKTEAKKNQPCNLVLVVFFFFPVTVIKHFDQNHFLEGKNLFGSHLQVSLPLWEVGAGTWSKSHGRGGVGVVLLTS